MNPTADLRGRLHASIAECIEEAGGWLPCDRFMALALYEPALGYYARGERLFGHGPGDGSDFVTAPELSPLFGATLAVQVLQALDAVQAAGGAPALWEFGAGSGALAAQLLDALGERVQRCHVVELSAPLQARQRERLARFGERVVWHAELPARLQGAVVGNEVLDAMPVQLLRWDGQRWFERGVVAQMADRADAPGAFAWADRPTLRRPPTDPASDAALPPGYLTEIHPQAEAFVRTLADRLALGAAFFIDYGFPEHEYFHPQRVDGTLMCHRAHLADADPLADIGEKDITAHVNFSAIALAAQDAGLDVAGYTSQARFLLNCGLLERLRGADARVLAPAQKLLAEHEMGELFKVIALSRGLDWQPLGFAAGDRRHRL